MMKWKVVKSPRSASADRSLECLRNDVQLAPLHNNHNDSNNNVGEDNNNNNKESNRQRDSSLLRKPSILTTECINLKSILGLTRQRSETNLSCLGLICSEVRRSRSEVRGLSCDRLTLAYHSAPPAPPPPGKTRSSSPGHTKTGWLSRGRKREREARNQQEVAGKTVVTGSSRKRTSSKTSNGDGRTIVDGSDVKQKNNKPCPSSLEHRKGKNRKDEDIIEEEIYAEIDHDKLLLQEDAFKEPLKGIRKKGLAPKPQVATELFPDEPRPTPPDRKPPRKNHENRVTQSVRLNNQNDAFVKVQNNLNAQSVVAIAEIHSELLSLSLDNENRNTKHPESTDTDDGIDPLPHSNDASDRKNTEDEFLPFHIDTPDYSTLESVNISLSTEDLTFSKEDVTFSKEDLTFSKEDMTFSKEDMTFSKEDILNCNTDCEEDNARVSRELSLSSILRDSASETGKVETETKKTVRFEKLDLIESYKKHKTESCMDTEDDADLSASESLSAPSCLATLDVNSNEIEAPCSSSHSPEIGTKPDEDPADLCVNAVVLNPSPEVKDIPGEEHTRVVQCPTSEQTRVVQCPTSEHSPTPFVVKKSFVLTVAKQEKGFRSLCANKRPEPVPADPHISVTFSCSAPASKESEEPQRPRSTSVPPQASEGVAAFPSARGRSRDRKSKDRQHCKKNHKSRKKDAVFVMPQAVIDELSQVLEKRKPSLEDIRHLHP